MLLRALNTSLIICAIIAIKNTRTSLFLKREIILLKSILIKILSKSCILTITNAF